MHARYLVPLSFALSLSGCASILGGGSSQNVSIKPSPGAATFVVKSSSGIEMSSGTGEQTIRLPRKNEYQVEIRTPGYQNKTVAITKSLNGWVWGNLVVGWVVGFAIDFVSGAAYKLEPALLTVTLDRAADGDSAVAHVLLYNADGKLLRDIAAPLVPVQ